MERIVKGYRADDALRRSFDALAQRTFGLTFEDWYQNGFWGDDYVPYSVVVDGAVAANVSVNRTDFVLDGEKKRFIQLGTVMADERYRGRGMIRRLMAEVERDCAGKADGVYLFANDTVLDFYPKFGFRRAAEVRYARALEPGGAVRRVQLGFTPLDTTGWEAEAVHENDTTLFVRGAGFRDFERRGLMFPVLAHA